VLVLSWLALQQVVQYLVQSQQALLQPQQLLPTMLHSVNAPLHVLLPFWHQPFDRPNSTFKP
jgi:hypothetical protein